MSSTITEMKRPDAFMSNMTGFFTELGKHTRGLLVGLALLLAVGVGIGFYLNQREARTENARNALFVANRALQSDMKQLAPQAPAPASKDAKAKPKAPDLEALEYQKLDVDSKFADAVQKFMAVDQKFSGTRSAFDARLELGDLYFNHGEAAQALPWYRKAVDSAPGGFEKAVALSSVGYAFENSAQPKQAIEAYEKAINQGQASVKGDLLLGIARCYEALNDMAKARATYDRILTEMSDTEYAKTAELFKSKLK